MQLGTVRRQKNLSQHSCDLQWLTAQTICHLSFTKGGNPWLRRTRVTTPRNDTAVHQCEPTYIQGQSDESTLGEGQQSAMLCKVVFSHADKACVSRDDQMKRLYLPHDMLSWPNPFDYIPAED